MSNHGSSSPTDSREEPKNLRLLSRRSRQGVARDPKGFFSGMAPGSQGAGNEELLIRFPAQNPRRPGRLPHPAEPDISRRDGMASPPGRAGRTPFLQAKIFGSSYSIVDPFAIFFRAAASRRCRAPKAELSARPGGTGGFLADGCATNWVTMMCVEGRGDPCDRRPRANTRFSPTHGFRSTTQFVVHPSLHHNLPKFYVGPLWPRNSVTPADFTIYPPP